MFFNFNYFLLILFMIFIMMYKFSSSYLMILISMEFLVVTSLILILNYEVLSFNEWFFLFYMIFSVCESVIGLSILINLIYFYGNQSINFLYLSW